MIWYILRAAGFREVMFVFTVLFTELCMGTEEQCSGNLLKLLIRKAELGRDEVFSRYDPLMFPWVSCPDPLT